MMNREANHFLKRLQDQMNLSAKKFDVDTAEKLCDEIHKAESEGYAISHLEDMVWASLTERIGKANNDPFFK